MRAAIYAPRPDNDKLVLAFVLVLLTFPILPSAVEVSVSNRKRSVFISFQFIGLWNLLKIILPADLGYFPEN